MDLNGELDELAYYIFVKQNERKRNELLEDSNDMLFSSSDSSFQLNVVMIFDQRV